MRKSIVKPVNHSPNGSGFTSFSRLLPTSRVVYCAGKPIERVVYCLNRAWVDDIKLAFKFYFGVLKNKMTEIKHPL